jgi:parallel beta-helix repeat protein
MGKRGTILTLSQNSTDSQTGEFDVFLCHHSTDKPAVKEIAKELMKCQIRPWLDEWELRPGLPWQEILEQEIENIKSVAVFIGREGTGPWQSLEIKAFLQEFVERKCPVIPVILHNAPENVPKLPIFLKGFTWVDFRKTDPDPMERLIWGITGKKCEIEITKAQEIKETQDLILTPPAGVTANRAAKITELPTIVVDQNHHGDYITISGAIAAAAPKSKILIRPGIYEEGLIIDKPLEIVGDGDLGKVVVKAAGKEAILFKTNEGKISNLALKQIGGGNWYGVDISQGCLELETCDITSDSRACVAIHGNAYPILRENTIHDGKSSGVYVFENGYGVIENNEIFGNALSGIGISKGGNPTVRGNKIRDGKQDGVMVEENGLGLIENNDIIGNAFAGIEIRRGGNPTVRNNRINKNGYEAVWIHDKGAGTIEDNDLRENEKGAWDISADSKNLVKRARNLEK